MEKANEGNHIEKEYPFELKEAKWRNIFHWLFGMFLIAGLLGFFGNGIVSHKVLEGDGFTIKYQRFIRVDAPSKLEIFFTQTDPLFKVSVPNQYLEKVELRHVVPAPESVQLSEEEQVFTFKVDRGGLVTFFLHPSKAGHREFKLGVQDNRVELSQFVYF